MSRRLLLACLAVTLAACSSPATEPDAGEPVDAGPIEPVDAGPTATLTLSASPLNVALPQGTSVTIPLSVTYDGESAPILEVSGDGSGLEAAPDPQTVDGRLLPVLHLRAARDAAVRTATVVLNARADGLAKSVEIAVAVTRFEDPATGQGGLAGRVVDQRGQPVPGALVRVGGRSTASDGLGRFTFDGVTTPYDIDVVQTDLRIAYRYVGLTRRDPIISVAGEQPMPNAWAVTGSLMGGTTPAPEGSTYFLANDAPRMQPEALRLGTIDGSNYDANFPFFGEATTRGNLWAVQLKQEGGRVTGFLSAGQGSANMVSADRSTLNIRMNRTTTATVSGTLQLPEGFTLSRRRAWLSKGSLAGLMLASEDSPQELAFSYPVPNAPGFHVSVTATATRGDEVAEGRLVGLPPGTKDAVLALAPPLEITTPFPSGATIAATVPFAWTDSTRRLYAAVFGGDGDPTFVVVTQEAQARLPDLAELGLALPSGKELGFKVMALAPYASIDEAAGWRGVRYDHALPVTSLPMTLRDVTGTVDATRFQLAAP